MKREECLRKVQEIHDLSKEGNGFTWLLSAVSWLLKDRIDQLVEQASEEKE